MEKKERVEALLEFIRIGQEGKVRPDKNASIGREGSAVVRDAKYASPYLVGACKKLAEELDFTDLVTEDLRYDN